MSVRARRLLPLVSFIFVVAGLPGCRTSEPDDRPNILLILADDLGFSDISPYGGEIRTPNLQSLADGGVRFTQFYNAGRCCPTRASLLTGRYPHEVGMGRMVSGVDEDPEPGPYQGYVDTLTVTLADALRDAGYGTYMSGKWHVGEKPAYWPRRQGFDRYFGLISGASSYFELIADQPRTRQMALDDEPWTPPAQGFYMTDAITDYALEFLAGHEAKRPEDPVFLYVAYTAPHWPLHALPEDIQRYEGAYDGGWDSLRAERYARMRDMGLIDAHYPLTPPTEGIPMWEEVSDRSDWTRRMEVYAAMVDRMDRGIGRILRALDAGGRLENTVVMFLSDNGASAENIAGRRLHDPAVPIGARGSYVAYREPWANASNTPLRLYKSWQHEGGVATPLVMSWPRAVTDPGAVSRTPGHVIDIFPTLLELAAVEHADAAGRPLPGFSLVPVLRDPAIARERMLFFEHIGNRALRDNNLKAVYRRDRPDWELYDMERDPTESIDLAADRPEELARLRGIWETWADSLGVER